MALQKGSKITARGDSTVNVLDYPTGTANVIATFEPFTHVGYAVSDEVFFDRTSSNNPTIYVEVFYFSEDTFLPVAVGYVDQDSVDIGEPETNTTNAPVKDQNGNPLPTSQSGDGITIKTKDGQVIVIVPDKTQPKTAFPTWAKWTIIGVASVLLIVAGVWIYKQFKKPAKKS